MTFDLYPQKKCLSVTLLTPVLLVKSNLTRKNVEHVQLLMTEKVMASVSYTAASNTAITEYCSAVVEVFSFFLGH